MQKDTKNKGSKAGRSLVSLRWSKKTEKEKSEYGKMMVRCREEKRKLKVVSLDKEQNIEINKN